MVAVTKSAGEPTQADFHEAISNRSDRWFAACLRITRNHDLAEDAVQEVFVRIWQTAARYDHRRAKLVTWVMLIARRHLIDRLRRNAVRGTAASIRADGTSDEGERQPEYKPLEDERNRSLLLRIAELPELQRVVIERAYLQGFTLREVSAQLGAPLGTVKSALSRGLARLRERVRADWAV